MVLRYEEGGSHLYASLMNFIREVSILETLKIEDLEKLIAN
jgi:hypothetical protein